MIAEILVKSSKSMMRSMFCFDRAVVCFSIDHPRDQNEHVIRSRIHFVTVVRLE